MSLIRQRKDYLNKLYKNLLEQQNLLFLQFNNFNVKELNQLRSRLGELDSNLTVIRSGVFRGLTEDIKLKSLLNGNICLISFNELNPANLKKVLTQVDTIKSNSRFKAMPLTNQSTDTVAVNPKLTLLGGHINNQTVDIFTIRQLANLPTLEQIHAQIYSLITTPSSRIHSHIQHPSQHLSLLLKSHSNHQQV